MAIVSQDHDVTGRIARFLSSRKRSVARVGEGETDFSSAGARSSAFVAWVAPPIKATADRFVE